MSHHIYNTKGVILNSRTQREADRVYSILTEDLGLVRATAQGVRKGSSKLGGILMKFSLINLSLVKGRNIWRITTATGDERVKWSRMKLVSLARVLSLLEKLIHGEEKSKKLFQTLVESIEFLKSVEDNESELWEVLVVSRLLNSLGYMSPTETLKGYLTDEWSQELIRETLKNKKNLVQLINKGLKESGF
ncbi:DNA repair protein RecO [Candidatus Parcubacteria bacterium]|nr:DNA repair protein RecO [Candidatus Parcubacteria bacterium]